MAATLFWYQSVKQKHATFISLLIVIMLNMKELSKQWSKRDHVSKVMCTWFAPCCALLLSQRLILF